jgi:hypothetical protein
MKNIEIRIIIELESDNQLINGYRWKFIASIRKYLEIPKK